MFPNYIKAAEGLNKVDSMDSIWVNIASAKSGQDHNGNPQVSIMWKVFIKKYDKQKGTYSAWQEIKEPKNFTFKAEVATDSAFKNIVESHELQDLNYTFTNLKFAQHYYWRVQLISPQCPSRNDFAEGIQYKHEINVNEKDNLFSTISNFYKHCGFLSVTLLLAILIILGLSIVLYYSLRSKAKT